MADKIEGLYHNFIFIGTPVIPRDREKFYQTQISESGYKWSKIKFGVKVSDNNTQFLELMGGFNTKKENIVYSFDNQGNNVQIDWSDRYDKGIISTISEMRKFKMNFTSSDEKDSTIMLAEYDVVNCIAENLATDKRVVITGEVVFERFVKDGKAQVTMKYNPRKIRLAKEEEENKAELTMSFVFDNECYNDSELAKTHKIDMMGYVTTHVKALKQNVFVPVNFVIDVNHLIKTSSVKMDAEKVNMLLGLYKGYLTCDRGEYWLTQWKVEPFNGNTFNEITEDDLSEDMKLQIALGMLSFEQAKRDMRNYKAGDRINELKLIRPTNKFEDEKTQERKVSIPTEYKEEDFYIPENTVEDKNALFNNTTENKNNNDEDILNKLFPLKQ